MPPIQALLTLAPGERRLLAQALLLVAVVRVALWVLPSRRIVRTAGAPGRAPRPRTNSSASPDRVAWAVSAASRRVPAATCLTQAVAARLLLRMHGHDARICLGVARRPDGGLRAHAWLEHQGRILVGGEESQALTRLPDPYRARHVHPQRQDVP